MSAQMRPSPENSAPEPVEIPGLAYYSAAVLPLRPVKAEAPHPQTAAEVLDQMYGYYAAA